MAVRHLLSNLLLIRFSIFAAGLWSGALAYGFVMLSVGWSTWRWSFAAATGELSLVLQYLVLALSLSLVVGLTAAAGSTLRGRRITTGSFLTAFVAATVFSGCFLASELGWILNHRPFNPANLDFLFVTALTLTLAGLAAAIARWLFLRYFEVLRKRWLPQGAILLSSSVILLGLATQEVVRESTLNARPASNAALDWPAAHRDGGKVVIIGIDGATWKLMGPMIQRGELPNLENLVVNGVSGPLAAFEPIESPRIWTSIATGKTPEKHGIQEFLIDRRFIRTSPIWQIADTAGKRVGLYDWLVTYPPPEINGFVIPGWLAGGKTITHPPGLDRTLFLVRALRNPFWFLKTALVRLPTGYLDEARGNPLSRTINSHFVRADFKELDFPYLLATWDPDLFAVVFYGADVFGHTLWQYLEPEHFPTVDTRAVARYRDVIPAYYRKVDSVIGKIHDYYGDSATFCVVSDHGFRAGDKIERINYIAADPLLADLSLRDVAQAVGGAKDYALIDMKGLPSSRGEEEAKHAATVIGALEAIRSVTTGEPVFRVETETSGQIRLEFNPALDLAERHRIRLGDEVRFLDDYVQPAVLSGVHDLQGILILYGPGIRKGHRIADASVLDITPTLLYRLGLPVGEDMDGKVLSEAFAEGWLRERPIQIIVSYDSGPRRLSDPPDRPDIDSELLKRLRSLGYLK
jgi:predicted AlkP superfamily phosphohydrolase/phosphomutase